jgi:hypothetical protein
MSEIEKQYGEVFRMELRDIHERMETSNSVPHDSYLLGVADGIVIMASHMGIMLRPDLVEDTKE